MAYIIFLIVAVIILVLIAVISQRKKPNSRMQQLLKGKDGLIGFILSLIPLIVYGLLYILNHLGRKFVNDFSTNMDNFPIFFYGFIVGGTILFILWYKSIRLSFKGRRNQQYKKYAIAGLIISSLSVTTILGFVIWRLIS